MKTYREMVGLFEESNARFLKRDNNMIINQVSERTLCGALMCHINSILLSDKKYDGYYADVEYNRNGGAIKTILGIKMQVIPINCDLIVHSRGEIVKQDNLIAIEMKKSSATNSEKNKDRMRLLALTKDSFDDIWSFDGRSLPEHVCRYVLGVYYEINYKQKTILIEYYRKGRKVKNYLISLRLETNGDTSISKSIWRKMDSMTMARFRNVKHQCSRFNCSAI